MATAIRRVIELNGAEIQIDGDGMVDLTAIWKASKTDAKRDPGHFRRLDSTQEFIASLAEKLDLQICKLWVSRRGKNSGGTWAHYQVALAYAKWLSPEMHRLVNEAFLEWAEEERNPDLKVVRAIEKWLKVGRSYDWIADRLAGIIKRKELTDVLRDHGCLVRGWDNPYMIATQLVSKSATGMTADEIKRSEGVSLAKSSRDVLSKRDVNRITFLEKEIAETIRDKQANGNSECLDIVKDVTRRFGQVFGDG